MYLFEIIIHGLYVIVIVDDVQAVLVCGCDWAVYVVNGLYLVLYLWDYGVDAGYFDGVICASTYSNI